MAVTINGTTGITTPEVALDNSAADGGQVVLKSSGYGTWNLDNYSGRLRGYYNSTEYFTVDASGNVGIGVTPSAWSGVGSVLQVGTSAAIIGNNVNSSSFISNAYFDGTNYKYIGTGFATRFASTSGAYIWNTAASGTAGNAISFTQAMTLDASGNLLVGTTSTDSGRMCVEAQTNGYAISFRRNTGVYGSNTKVGQISCDSTSTVYSTSSDYRLKDNVQPMQGALNTVAQLKPVTYKWKETGKISQGFIAHELQAVIPDCVTGEKDAVDAEGNPVYQGIDTSFLVATLTAAIQELKTELDSVKAELAALKGQP